MKESLTPYRLKKANEWLAARPKRFRTKRLRKKFYDYALRYIRLSNIEALKWFYDDVDLKYLVYSANPALSLLKDNDEFQRKYIPIPIHINED